MARRPKKEKSSEGKLGDSGKTKAARAKAAKAKAAKAKTKLENPYQIILDECLARKKENGPFQLIDKFSWATPRLLVDMFDEGVKDFEWIPLVHANKRQVVFTKDERILRREIELGALIRTNTWVCVFKLKDMGSRGIESVMKIAIPKIGKLLAQHQDSDALIITVSAKGIPTVQWGRRGYPKNRTIRKLRLFQSP